MIIPVCCCLFLICFKSNGQYVKDIKTEEYERLKGLHVDAILYFSVNHFGGGEREFLIGIGAVSHANSNYIFYRQGKDVFVEKISIYIDEMANYVQRKSQPLKIKQDTFLLVGSIYGYAAIRGHSSLYI